MKPAPIPSADANPTPQAAHPGINAAKKIPVPPRKLIFLFSPIPNLTLYEIKLNKIPKRIEIIIKLT